jgi:hypothetical protein
VNQVPFSGKLGSSASLPPGDYTVTLVATNSAGQKSSRQTIELTIV